MKKKITLNRNMQNQIRRRRAKTRGWNRYHQQRRMSTCCRYVEVCCCEEIIYGLVLTLGSYGFRNGAPSNRSWIWSWSDMDRQNNERRLWLLFEFWCLCVLYIYKVEWVRVRSVFIDTVNVAWVNKLVRNGKISQVSSPSRFDNTRQH